MSEMNKVRNSNISANIITETKTNIPSQSNSRLSNESSNPKSDTNVDTINEVPTRDTQPTMNT